MAFFDNEITDTIVSTGFAVLSNKKNINPKFLAYFVQSEKFIDIVVRKSLGVSYPAINSSTLNDLALFCPNINEQTAIATYLDLKTTAIDKKTTLLEKKIEYYKELRKSLINQTVTKGLNKNVKLKHSGIEWIGEIPEHWEVKRLDNFFRERSEKVNDIDFIPLSVSMNGILPQMDSVAKTMNGENRKKVVKGDFVINSRSDRKGASGMSLYTGSVSVISIVLKPQNKIDCHFYHHFFKSNQFTEEFYMKGKGIVDDLWSTKFSALRIFEIVFPPLSEQTAIATYLDEKTSKIDQIISNLQSQIEKQKELRKVLINDVVTGKIMVSE